MRRFRLLLLLFLLIFALNLYAQQLVKPKNIILMIGDGMGLAQISAGKTFKGQLNLEKMKVVGLLTTHSCDEYSNVSHQHPQLTHPSPLEEASQTI